MFTKNTPLRQFKTSTMDKVPDLTDLDGLDDWENFELTVPVTSDPVTSDLVTTPLFKGKEDKVIPMPVASRSASVAIASFKNVQSTDFEEESVPIKGACIGHTTESSDSESDYSEEDDFILHTEWESMGLSSAILAGIYQTGSRAPFPPQQAIGSMINNDLAAKYPHLGVQANTGSGKTWGFAIPALHMIKENIRGPQAIILAPTKDLVLQIFKVFCELASCTNITIACHFGTSTKNDAGERVRDIHSSPYHSRAIEDKNKRPIRVIPGSEQIVIGTPARIASLFTRERNGRRGGECLTKNSRERTVLDPSNVILCVLDECDRLLETNRGSDSGITDIQYLIGEPGREIDSPFQPGLFDNARIFMYSATMSQEVTYYVTSLEAKILTFVVERKETSRVNCFYLPVREEKDKADAIPGIIDASRIAGNTVIFANNNIVVNNILNMLLEQGYSAAKISALMNMTERTKVIESFVSGRCNILVATDVIARGIDIDSVQLVIQHDLPSDPKDFIHRAGRSGRVNRAGLCISLVLSDSNNSVPEEITRITRETGLKIEMLTKTFNTHVAKKHIPGK